MTYDHVIRELAGIPRPAEQAEICLGCRLPETDCICGTL